MELASVMQKLSFRKVPRDGQKQVLQAVMNGGNHLNVQLPTGYGKTFTACAAYSILRDQGRVNRLLYITPTVAQHEQFIHDAHNDFYDAGAPKPHAVRDISSFKTVALKEHRTNQRQAFAINVQALITNDGMDRVGALLEQGQWMIVVDEYHHYGLDAVWGRRVMALNCAYRLAMSATPHRKNDDSAFGKPDVIVKYRDAVDERAVKPLAGHSYTYRIDAVTGEGEIVSFTTGELKEQLGEGDQLERARIERKMRWSPKYISPLVSIPIERMINQQLQTGHRLQAIVGAMCVSHAEMVCDQVRAMFPELAVDWVGTGVDGRTNEENAAVIAKFCPPKDTDTGQRKHTLDVLVHVGMAGEGLDSVNVSEVIHLNPASLNNSNNQENGRASRFLDGITGNINFDSCSEYAKKNYVGAAIMDAMDAEVAQVCDKCGNLPCICEDTGGDTERNLEIPEEPVIVIADMELIKIDSGGPDFKRFQQLIIDDPRTRGLMITRQNADDPQNIEYLLERFRVMRRLEAEQFNERATLEQLKDSVNKAVSQLVSTVIKKTHATGVSIQKSLAGDLKYRINRMKAQACGAISDDIAVCKMHYKWIYSLQQTIFRDGVPEWLK